MNRIALFLLLVSCTLCWAAPNPNDYPITVHVSSSRLVIEPSTIGLPEYEKLSVSIDGKKYELESINSFAYVLALGDYKAKLIGDDHKMSYEFKQTYEFLLPDNRVREFAVVGQTE